MDLNSSYETDAQQLRQAMKGCGTDESELIRLSTSRSNSQRMKIREFYSVSFGRDLIEDLISELSGNLKEALISLWRSPVEFDTMSIFLAVKGAGTEENILNEIIGSRSNNRLQEIKKMYENLYGENLEDRIRGETHGSYEKLLISLLQGKRDQSVEVSKEIVVKDAQDLYNAGENKWGTDEEIFNRIFALRSPQHLFKLNLYYQEQYGKDLISVVESEFSGDMKELLVTILHAHINPADYFAGRVYKACKGWGTDEQGLIRAIEVIDENFLSQVKIIYPTKYKITLENQITSETSGYLQSLLLNLIKN